MMEALRSGLSEELNGKKIIELGSGVGNCF